MLAIIQSKIYKTVILPVVLYGCETWSLTLRVEHRLRVFENRELRKIFGPKREEDGSWRKLHNDEFHNLNSSPNIFRVIKPRRMRWAGHVARMGRGEVFTGFWLRGPKARDHWEDLGVVVYTRRGYEVPGIILWRDLNVAMRLDRSKDMSVRVSTCTS
jgi:hypothetical protein